MLRSFLYAFLTVSLFIYGAVSPLLAQNIISVKEILNSPEHFYNQTVRIEGKVTDIRDSDGNGGGTYILHANDTDISVLSSILPELSKTYKVTVQVLKGEGDSAVAFKEISRTRRNIFKNFGYLFGGLAIVLLAALVFGGSGTITNAN